jgi:signal transduction histidine kinase
VKPQSAYLISLGSESSEIVFSRSVKEKTSIENAGNDLTQLNETSELVKLSKGKTIIIKEELPMVIAEEKAHAVAHDLAPFKGEAAVPLVIEKELAYLLILGEKLSGDAFSNEDIRLLTTVASQSAIALKNARLYDELEQRVQDMTDKILVAEKLESVGILAGGIAHDFNNILTAILGNISLAKVGFDPADKKYQLLTNSEHACLIAKSLSNKLITFSSGGTPMKQPASVEEVMRKALASSCDDHSIRYAVSIAGDLWSVEFDTQQMSEVFHHLILNAQEAMPQGGVITVSAENVLLDAQNPTPLPEGRYIKISIQDQGMGIPKKNLAKIFDPYFTTKQMGAVKGLGLGLAICYSVIRKHGGHISVESELGAGSTFHIYLPA